ncbi:MAG: mannosyl-3-phosphoglycerate synthase [Dehalococcoidia bacterium]
MFIESPRYTERFGAVRINAVQRVVSLDSGFKSELPPYGAMGVMKIDEDTIKRFEDKMAVVISIKDEKLKLFEGVISGLPHDCLIIVVSNSQQGRIDRFKMEKDALNQICRYTMRNAFIVHQKDPIIAEAVRQAGYSDILGEDGLIRDGKSEAMVIGLLMAKVARKEYVGFIDADNYFPGAVLEYVRNFAAGFSLARSPYSMVRILWHYKTKISGGIYFKKWGRVSETTNKCLNDLIFSKTDFETEVIRTGNAGEHAISMKLAELLPYASGYAVEPGELMFLFESFGGILPEIDHEAVEHGIDLFQIETRNPHMHEEKGTQHLKDMLLSGLATIYHSPLCEENTKRLILRELVNQGALSSRGKPPVPHFNAPIGKIDSSKFMDAIKDHIGVLYALHEE